MDFAEVKVTYVWGTVWGEKKSLAVEKPQGLDIIGGR